jgi:hypothetical protein
MRKILLIVLAFSSYIICQEFRFTREDITFRIDTLYFYVDGYYWFVNLSEEEIRKSIYFPVSKGGDIKTDSMEVYDVGKVRPVNIYSVNSGGFSFTAHIFPGDTAVYRIKYRQKINSDSVTYILLSTQQWNRPLDLAEYKLIVNNSTGLIGAAYKHDKIYTIGEDKIYYWNREKFMPDRDMVFHFRKIN